MTQVLVGMRDLLATIAADLEVRLAELNEALEDGASDASSVPQDEPLGPDDHKA